MVLQGNRSGSFRIDSVYPLLLSLALTAGLMPAVGAQSRPTDHGRATSQLDSLMKAGQDLAAQGRFAEAEVPLKQAAELAPEDYAVLTVLGKVEGRVGKHADAIAHGWRGRRFRADSGDPPATGQQASWPT